MLDCEEKKKGIVKSTSVTSFIPRQLLLSSSSSKSKMVQQTNSLVPQDRVDLLHTICQFLDLNGFRKTLKKFCDEADIKESGWKECSVNLEKMFQEHLQTSNDANKKSKEIQFEDGIKLEATLENGTLNGDNIKSKKKKKNKNIEPVEDTLSEPEKAVKKSKKNKQKDLGEQAVADSVSVPSEPLKKSKEKKKQHKDELEVPEKDSQGGKSSKKADDISLEVNEEKKEKKKSKKKKEEVPISKVGVDEDEKRSKKRKKSSSDENATGDDEDNSKRRKKDVSVEETNGPVEPTSAKAFQRVKVEEVKFVDDRLKDNSYWAKDGADSGYGAKAQEVLGQVRGKDFRHEKTKKKRGTYRGGQIDLQSHSIKFNYDDEE